MWAGCTPRKSNENFDNSTKNYLCQNIPASGLRLSPCHVSAHRRTLPFGVPLGRPGPRAVARRPQACGRATQGRSWSPQPRPPRPRERRRTCARRSRRRAALSVGQPLDELDALRHPEAGPCAPLPRPSRAAGCPQRAASTASRRAPCRLPGLLARTGSLAARLALGSASASRSVGIWLGARSLGAQRESRRAEAASAAPLSRHAVHTSSGTPHLPMGGGSLPVHLCGPR